jgi:hypothetical protein
MLRTRTVHLTRIKCFQTSMCKYASVEHDMPFQSKWVHIHLHAHHHLQTMHNIISSTQSADIEHISFIYLVRTCFTKLSNTPRLSPRAIPGASKPHRPAFFAHPHPSPRSPRLLTDPLKAIFPPPPLSPLLIHPTAPPYPKPPEASSFHLSATQNPRPRTRHSPPVLTTSHKTISRQKNETVKKRKAQIN